MSEYRYAPGITDQSGQLLAQGIGAAGSAIAGGIEKHQEALEKANYLNQKAAGFAQVVGPDGQPLMDAAKLEKFYKAGVGAKQGMLADTLFRYEQGLNKMQEAQKMDLENRKLALGRYEIDQNHAPWSPPPEVLDRYAKAGYAYLPQSARGGSAVPIKGDATEPPLGSDPTQSGQFFYDGSRLRQVKTPAPARPAIPLYNDDPRAKRIAEIDKEIANYQVELAKGNLYKGVDAIAKLDKEDSFSFVNRIKKLSAERETLAAALGSAPASPAAADPAAPAPAAARPAAPAARPLDKGTAAQFLQQAGGDRAKARELARQAGYTF
jgi:hypothetical protein